MSTPVSIRSAAVDVFFNLRGIQTTRYARLASNAIIFYDQLITFDLEVNSIWKSRWTFAKVLFLVNRYYGLASAIFNTYAFFAPKFSEKASAICVEFYLWEGWTGLVGCMLADIILQMRIYALYTKNKRVTSLMMGFFVICFALSAWIMGSSLKGLTAASTQIIGGQFCVSPLIPPHFYIFWIPMLSFELLLCSLAVIRAYESYHASGNPVFNGHRLFSILIRDSLVYFFAIGVTYLTCLVVWILEPNILLEAPIGFSLAISCTLGSRMILNLREPSREQEGPSKVFIELDDVRRGGV
ncbi:hypothetical protein GALMADRAFT_235216 [Galerina marginata CBS 339.88]|uniref:DUF6533 domain-containing protein n=1 Tax=Galerina marginata (strain CBS 339.88) TaxID=685588 RepID=A0A067U178_GALM3|nr:hypothetical protein GALMADRAFT_235216 [Galerina marginata CBS 339.88]